MIFSQVSLEKEDQMLLFIEGMLFGGAEYIFDERSVSNVAIRISITVTQTAIIVPAVLIRSFCFLLADSELMSQLPTMIDMSTITTSKMIANVRQQTTRG